MAREVAIVEKHGYGFVPEGTSPTRVVYKSSQLGDKAVREQIKDKLRELASGMATLVTISSSRMVVELNPAVDRQEALNSVAAAIHVARKSNRSLPR